MSRSINRKEKGMLRNGDIHTTVVVRLTIDTGVDRPGTW